MEQEKVWDAIAKDWKKFRKTPLTNVEDFLKVRTGKILDLGCGSGRNFMKLQGVEFYGVDFSGKMLELARGSVEDLGIEIDLRKAEVFETDFDDDFFDYVLCNAVLHCVDSAEKRKKTLEEIHRVLKPGGEAFVSVWGKNSPRLKDREKECFVPWAVEHERYTYVFDLVELEDLAREVGFEVVQSFEDVNVNVVLRKV